MHTSLPDSAPDADADADADAKAKAKAKTAAATRRAGSSTAASSGPRIRVGIGGWTYAPWRDNFYPPKWAQARELEYASRQLTAIEINGTFYRGQTPATYAKWRDETPDGFVFSLKAQRASTHRTVLAEAGESVQRFVRSGIAELGPKLGPIVWQFAPTKRYDESDFGAFLALLPNEVDGTALRHVVEVRHPSFMAPEFVAQARQHGVAAVCTDSAKYPSFCDLTGATVYARLMAADAGIADGYSPEALRRWADIARGWSKGDEPVDLPRIVPAAAEAAARTPVPRDVYVFFINGAKERAPAAAMALLAALAAPDA